MKIINPHITIRFCLSSISLFFLIISSGCAPVKTTVTPSPVPRVEAADEQSPKVMRNLGSIAVYDVAIKHPTARRVYRSENIRDRITRGLQQSNSFKITDWGRLEEVLFRRNLESSDLVEDAALRKEIGDFLLNDYFLQGTVTAFGEKMEYSSSAFSKQKKQIVEVELELFVKNALTNEVIASANGHGITENSITQTLGFGAAGGDDTVAANRALDIAVVNALAGLLDAMKDISPPVSISKAMASSNNEIAMLRQPGIKVLVILAETEASVNGKIVKDSNNDRFTSSIVEKTMAKVFSDAEYQVVTADDVLGKAYGVQGDENILLSGWVTEQDVEELENLLQARTGLASYAVKVGKIASADIVISGEVKYELGDASGPGSIKATTNNVILSAKAILVHSKKTYHISIVKDSYMGILQPNTMAVRETALIKAASAAGQELLVNTPKIEK